jgi:hypothetical protein
MKVAPTQRKPKNRRVTFRFPMPSVRASIPSAVANGSSNPKIQRQHQSILATRSSVCSTGASLARNQDRRLARLQAHARNHAAQTRMVRESQGRHSWAFKACSLRMVCTTIRIKPISAKHSGQSHLSCYEMLRNQRQLVTKLLKMRRLVPAGGIEPSVLRETRKLFIPRNARIATIARIA